MTIALGEGRGVRPHASATKETQDPPGYESDGEPSSECRNGTAILKAMDDPHSNVSVEIVCLVEILATICSLNR